MAAFDLNSIGSLFSGEGLSAIASRVKLSKEDVAKVLSAGIPALVGGMRRNAGAEEGAASLSKALADHSGDDVSDPGAFLKNADLQDGKKILGHVLGEDQDALVSEISQASGVTKAKTTSILSLASPLLLSVLGNQNSGSSNSGSGNLLGLLGGLLGGGSQSGGSQTSQSAGGGLLSGLLGGSNSSNANLTSGLLSSLLGGGSQSGQSNQNTQNSQGSGLLDGLMNLFH